jgi:hypothetical protein
MRDIRSDLQDRANLLEEQISAANAHFEKRIEQLQSERDAKVSEPKLELEAIAKLMDSERRRLNGSTPLVRAVQPQRSQVPLADFFVRKLSEKGTMSKDDLGAWAVRDGYFDDDESAGRAVNATLVNLAKSDRIQQLPDGSFAPASLSQTLKLRRVI